MIIVGEVVKLRDKIQWFEQTVLNEKSLQDSDCLILRKGGINMQAVLYVGHGSRIKAGVEEAIQFIERCSD